MPICTTSNSELSPSETDEVRAADHTITQLKTFVFPTWLGGQLLTFVPTGSIPNHLHERSAKKRAPLQSRLRSILIKDGAIFHLFFVAFCAAAVISAIARAHQRFPEHGAQFGTYLLTHLGWMPMPWLFSFFACLTPIFYAVFPPTVPDREDLLIKDPLTGARYPKQSARGVTWVPELLGFEKVHIIVFVYSLYVLYQVSSW